MYNYKNGDIRVKSIPADTNKDAYLMQIAILREMSPEKRADLAFEMSDNMRENAIEGIKCEHPGYTTEQIRNELLRRVAGEKIYKEIAIAKGLE